VLLAMGRDDAPALLRHADNGDLEVKLALLPAAPVYSQQERLMRDIAAALHGKLRVNPAWAFGRKPITVHGQGGCCMADTADDGVTDGHGQVFGHAGLFVIDGAIFPSSVGVNPSATIAAVAERNIEWFLGELKNSIPQPGWAALNAQLTRAWVANAQGWTLTPPVGSGLEPVSQPVGVKFTEKMSGYLAQVARPGNGDDDAYEAAEIAGRPACSVSLDLTVTVFDIAQFLNDDERMARVTGSAEVRTPQLTGVFDIEGVLQLFPEDGDPTTGFMDYHLQLFAPNQAGTPDDAERTMVAALNGYKRVHDDPGLDLWPDTTTLFCSLTPQGKGMPASHGAVHVGLDEFAVTELPSFNVTGTDDPARIVWALSAFNAYFFKSVQRVFVPQLNKAVDLIDSIGLR